MLLDMLDKLIACLDKHFRCNVFLHGEGKIGMRGGGGGGSWEPPEGGRGVWQWGKSLRSAALLFGHCLFWDKLSSPLVEAESATDKNPKLCVSV